MNILICGLGSIGRRHLKILKDLGDHRFIAYRSGKSTQANDEPVDEEIETLENLTEKKIDAALITNLTSLHVQTAIEIVKNGIPVFIEKPLGKNLDNIIELKELVKSKNVPVQIGYNFIYHPAIIAIKKIISEQKIGKVVSARAQFGTDMPGWHPYEDYKKSYAANSSMGGGVVLTSIHEQNYLTDLFGEVTESMAMECGGNVTGINAEEGVEILLKHNSGIVSNIHLNFFQKPYYRNCQILGTEGTVYWDFMIPEVKILFKDKTEVIKLGDDPMDLLQISYRDQMKHFLEVVEGKDKPRVTLDTGINDMKTALKILKDIGRNYN